jgi:hypothetical protein
VPRAKFCSQRCGQSPMISRFSQKLNTKIKSAQQGHCISGGKDVS